MSRGMYHEWLAVTVMLAGVLLSSCAPAPSEPQVATPGSEEPEPVSGLPLADVISVAVTGDAGAYRFSVEIASPDEGCDQYADWWEVLTEDGQLIYRRILAHSHVNEQPFVRSGGPVAVGPDEVVVVRAHMHPGEYGGSAMRGTAAGRFEPVELAPDFAAGVEREEPQPAGCDF